MASIKMGAVVTTIAGKIGGTVFRRGKGASTMSNRKTRSTHLNQKGFCCYNPLGDGYSGCWYIGCKLADFNAGQYTGRVASQWKSLTEAQQATWNTGAVNFTARNTFGDSYTPSGYNLYVKTNQARMMLGYNPITECPAPVVLYIPPIIAFSACENQAFNINLNEPIREGYMLAIQATGGFSTGRKNFAGGYKLVTLLNNLAGTSIDISEVYRHLWGYIKKTTKIKVRYCTIHIASGLRTEWVTDTIFVKDGPAMVTGLSVHEFYDAGVRKATFTITESLAFAQSWVKAWPAMNITNVSSPTDLTVTPSQTVTIELTEDIIFAVTATDTAGNKITNSVMASFFGCEMYLTPTHGVSGSTFTAHWSSTGGVLTEIWLGSSWATVSANGTHDFTSTTDFTAKVRVTDDMGNIKYAEATWSLD